MPLQDAARQVVLLTLAHYALLLLLGTGNLVPPEQKSLMPKPSFCKAPPAVYEEVGILNFFFAPAAVALAGVVACHCHHHQVAAAGAGAGAGAGAAPHCTLRALLLLAVALSATAAGVAMKASFLVLQVKAGLLACHSGSLRVPVYASYMVVGPVLLLCYLDLARMAFL